MGEQNVNENRDGAQIRAFTKAILEDAQALERMLQEGLIETGVRRIGAEQELFLVDRAMRPTLTALEILKELNDKRFTTELALFNLEANLSPQALGGKCLSKMEAELEEVLGLAHDAAALHDTRLLMVGILPTLRKKDLTLDAMTPNPRYRQLNDILTEQRGGQFHLFMKGPDELQVTHDNLMFEACNTSFQVHFQANPELFAAQYNLAQAVTGPVLAAAVNSPVFLQHRLWQETRVALFQQSMDGRSQAHQARQARQRVSFGERWVKESVLEIFREDIARFRVLLAMDYGESPLAMLDRGTMPPLKALCLHNGTVYRWNRPCYGVKDNVAHLRIEHRLLGAGPTVIDEIANAALFFGLMSALAEEYGDITQVMTFDAARNNFVAAARYGLKAQFTWVNGRTATADTLLLEHLLPLARKGLAAANIDSDDIDRYLGVIEERVRIGRTGSQWFLDSLAATEGSGTTEQRYQTVTAGMYRRQREGLPVHEWTIQDLDSALDWRDAYRTVEQVMTTDLFTVNPEDLIDLAANVMDWEHIRHVPVENEQGHLVGILSHRRLLRMLARGRAAEQPVPVRDVMRANPVSVTAQMSTLDAIRVMRENKVGCLPVVDQDNRLVGIVTERDFINVAARLLEQHLQDS